MLDDSGRPDVIESSGLVLAVARDVDEAEEITGARVYPQHNWDDIHYEAALSVTEPLALRFELEGT